MELNGITDIALFLNDEAAAQEAFANLRWPNGEVCCPLCEGGKKVYEVKYVRRDARTGEVKPSDRKQWKCGACRKKFSVTSGSIFEGSHIKVGHWIYAVYMMCSSKKGVSAAQIARQIKITHKSAWFMLYRVREALLQEPLAGMLCKSGDFVELDETFVGGKKRNNRHAKRTAAAGKKIAVMTLLDRDGDVKTVPVPNVRNNTLQELAKPLVDKNTWVITDAHLSYTGLKDHFMGHSTVDHSKSTCAAWCSIRTSQRATIVC